jgi:hypothetical protein
MSGLFKQFKTDTNKELNGVDIEFAEAVNEDGSIPTFTLSRMGKSNKKYAKAIEAASRPYRRQIELGTMKPEVSERIFLEVFAETILVGWKNVYAEDGSDLKYSKDAAIALMSALPDVYDRLQLESTIASNFRDSALENEAKN